MMPGFIDQIRPEETKIVEVEYFDPKKSVTSPDNTDPGSPRTNRPSIVSDRSTKSQVSLLLTASRKDSLASNKKTELVSPCRLKMREFLSHPYYVMASNMLIIFSLLQFAITDYFIWGPYASQYIMIVLIGVMVNNLIFLIDLILHLVAFGHKNLFKHQK